jgi:hypothetical protein
MIDEVYREFFRDRQTERVLESSEVWRNYKNAELTRDGIRHERALKEKLDAETRLLNEVEDFRQKVAENPKLKAYLQKCAAVLKQQPELRTQVDPNFLKGLDLLDLED